MVNNSVYDTCWSNPEKLNNEWIPFKFLQSSLYYYFIPITCPRQEYISNPKKYNNNNNYLQLIFVRYVGNRLHHMRKFLWSILVLCLLWSKFRLLEICCHIQEPDCGSRFLAEISINVDTTYFFILKLL